MIIYTVKQLCMIFLSLRPFLPTFHLQNFFKTLTLARQSNYMGKQGQRQLVLWVWGHSGLHSKYQASQGYTVNPCLKEKEKEKKTKSSCLLYSFQLYHSVNFWQWSIILKVKEFVPEKYLCHKIIIITLIIPLWRFEKILSIRWANIFKIVIS